MKKKVKVVGSFGGVFRLGFARFRPPIARAAHVGDRVASTPRGEQVPYRATRAHLALETVGAYRGFHV